MIVVDIVNCSSSREGPGFPASEHAGESGHPGDGHDGSTCLTAGTRPAQLQDPTAKHITLLPGLEIVSDRTDFMSTSSRAGEMFGWSLVS